MQQARHSTPVNIGKKILNSVDPDLTAPEEQCNKGQELACKPSYNLAWSMGVNI